ncbi:MAG: EAL domain-containing protein [Betaproteobacteria bacterium]|nr:EAL domain-containing protein [Betaproteobacteria bacterium]
MIPVGSYYTRDHHGLSERSRDAERDLQLRAKLVEILLRQALLAPDLLIAGVPPAAVTSPEPWEAPARRILKGNEIISRVEIVPEGRPGLSLAKDQPTDGSSALTAAQWPALASQRGRLASHGQAIVTVSRESFVVKQAVQLLRANDQSQPWGHIRATIDLDDLSRIMEFDSLTALGYSIRLDYLQEGFAGSQNLIAAGGDLREDVLSHEIKLMQGDRIRLRESPPDSWNVPPIAFTELVLLLIGGFLVGLLTYLLLRRSAEMREQVALRTLQLALDKETLKSEVERRKETESQLQDSHGLLDSIFEHIPSMIVLKRASDLKVVRVNRLGESIFGKSRSELLGLSSKGLYQGEQIQRDAETDLAAIRERILVEIPEQLIELPDGVSHWVKVKKIALFDAAGEPSHVLEIGEDITARKHLDEALTENLNFVEQLLAAIPTPVFFKDANLRYIGVNKAFEDFYGTTGESLIGKTVYDIAPPELAAIYDKADRELLASRGKQTYEARVRCADGVEKDVVFFKAVFSTTQSEVGGIVGILLDVTEQKAAERHVLRLNRTLAVVSEANEAILRTRESATLIQETVDILHRIGGFPLAWVYANNEDLPAMVVIGEHAELATGITTALRIGGCRDPARKAEFATGRCSFFATLVECDKNLAQSPAGFESHGLAHLPLRVAGRIAGGICIVGLGEDLADTEEQRLLASLAESLSHALDSLEQERARQIAERKLELAAHVFENSAEGVMITDRDNKILMVNRRFSEITGYSTEEVTGNTPSILNSGQQDKAFYSNMWRSLMNRGEWHGEIRNRRKDGEVIVEWMNISAVKNDAGEIVNFVAVFSEITVHKTIKKRMQFLAHYDALTSLPNRILFSDRLEQSIIAARRTKRFMALMLIDLDRFDQINKAVGHSAGDMLLQEVSSRLLASVETGNCVARLGGDEFAIVLSDIASTDEAAAAANRIQQELGRALYVDNSELYITASVGISVYPKDGDDAEALTRSADAAMYLAAEAGGNTYRFPQANEKLSDQIRLRERLHRAIERDELKVFYQPLVSGETGRIIGAEALLRWFRPEAGYVSPEFFVPMLEEAGLAVRVGDWVLRTALADNAAWRREFDSELFIAVNYCAAQIADEKAVEKVDIVMKELAFDAHHLQLEISEGTLMHDAPAGLTLLHRFSDLGITLSMDNFGTGYSSLSYLNRFPIDTLKIDRTFIQDTPFDAEAVAITRTIIAMGHALNLKVVAAGVESADQVNFLRRARCDVLQGYRFSQGVSAEEFAKLLAENQKAGSLFPEANGSDRLHLVG